MVKALGLLDRKIEHIVARQHAVDDSHFDRLAGTDRLREQEKRQRETEERLQGTEAQLAQANESIGALNGEKDKGLEREKGLKARLEIAQSEVRKTHEELDAVKRRAAAEADLAAKELERERSEHERSRREGVMRVSQLEEQHLSSLKQAEDNRLSELSALEKNRWSHRALAAACWLQRVCPAP